MESSIEGKRFESTKKFNWRIEGSTDGKKLHDSVYISKSNVSTKYGTRLFNRFSELYDTILCI